MANVESSSYLKSSAIVCALLAPLIIFFNTAQSIVHIWNTSETFAHGYIIIPISLWLIWRRKELLQKMNPQPFWPGLFALAACGFGWLLAELADVQVVRQYMLVLMILLSVITVLGWRLAWAMAFPLFFLILTVPFGEVFLAPLIDFTANFTVAALQATGIPVLREGNSFSIPSGSWSVVEACSGLRYLISSFTLGCLYAYLTYRSAARRVLFILFSIVVPIIANGLRAYMIVMIGHLSGMTLAVGFDHLIYGWLFFGLVMFFMFWIGNFWREPGEDVSSSIPGPAQAAPAPVSRIMLASLSVIASIGLWPAFVIYLDHRDIKTSPVEITQFQSNWQTVPAFASWQPDFSPAYEEFDRTYQKNTDQVGLHLSYYHKQNRAAGQISSTNQLVAHSDKNWNAISTSIRDERLGAYQLKVAESKLKGSPRSLLVWQLYWIDGTFLVSSYEGKLRRAKEKLLMRGDDGVTLFVYSPYEDNPEEARAALRDFMSQNLSGLESTFNQSKSLNNQK